MELSAKASDLRDRIVAYCRQHHLFLGGLVDELKVNGLTPLSARQLCNYAYRTSIQLDGMVEEVWALREAWINEVGGVACEDSPELQGEPSSGQP